MSSNSASSNADILGREDANDLEAILAITNQDVDEAIHAHHQSQ